MVIAHWIEFSYTKHRNEQSMETIGMNKSELTAFLMDKKKIPEEFIREFEMNSVFRDKDLLSLDGESSDV